MNNNQQQEQQSHPFFGSSFASNNNSSSFNAISDPFGQQHQQQQTPRFGGGFGNSARLFSSNNNNGFGSVVAASTNNFGSPSVGSAASTNSITPFGTNPFGRTSSTHTGNISSLPFPSSSSSVTSPTLFGATASMGGFRSTAPSTTAFRQDNPTYSTSSTAGVLVPNPFVSSTSSSSTHPFGSSVTTAINTNTSLIAASKEEPQASSRSSQQHHQQQQQQQSNDELTRLKAEIEKKKKKKKLLEEQKRNLLQQKQPKESTSSASDFVIPRKQQPQVTPNEPSNASSSTETSASIFSGTETKKEPQEDVIKKNKSSNHLHDRPLLRLLPNDLQEIAIHYKPPSMYDASSEERNENSSSSSLVGTCMSMCPTEELLRREYENDIPLLELPHPALHPSNWTLRDTCVKRFRRSAADYKLDIPSLVRPPIVLERSVSYLEEWVMERDRQGVDPRFLNYTNKSPPSLDVYQFVWDRTRMIRKDFILQNYIGMSGNNRGLCSAVAVRCHERIARWHVMMEHQLSHIPDYVQQQSVQNIQELGQTLKTLNQLYDDKLGRSAIEDEGEETAKFRHGCQSDVVQGSTPVDYDGVELINSNKTSRRIIENTANNGTAEAEMRGLYILLTMHNDGGMEVLKYAASLSMKNPTIFQSYPVQLALSVFRARKEWNYARFFQILRSSSTPYLFACIMYKYVDEMRKVALYVMSRAYGTRKSKEGEGVDDQYKLTDLVRLLCFEDENEARNACEHYGITVSGSNDKEQKDDDDWEEGSHEDCKSNVNEEKFNCLFISWRASYFLEPIDPIKGCKIPLKTRKMIRTIESKLGRATRLAVCRGELSIIGETSTSPSNVLFEKILPQPQRNRVALKSTRITPQAQPTDHPNIPDHPRKPVLVDEGGRESQDYAKQEIGKKQQSNQTESQKMMENMIKQQLELVRKKVKAEEEKKLVEQRSVVEAAERSRKEEEKKAYEAEMLRLQNEMILRAETERQKFEAAERLRIKQEEDNERIKRKEARERIEEERRRQEMERQKQLQEQELAEELHRQKVKADKQNERIREEQERIRQEWQKKMAYARKCLMLRLWNKAMVEKERRRIRASSITKIDLTYSGFWPNPFNILSFASHIDTEQQKLERRTTSLYMFFVRLSKEAACRIDVARILAARLTHAYDYASEKSASLSIRPVIMFKTSIIFPCHFVHDNYAMYSAILSWINSRVRLEELFTDRVDNAPSDLGEVRFVLVNGSDDEHAFDGCDAAIFVVPPDFDWPSGCSVFPLRSTGVPCKAALVFTDLNDVNPSLNRRLADELGEIAIITANAHLSQGGNIDNGLTSCFWHLLDLFREKLEEGYGIFERISLLKLGCRCIRKVLLLKNPLAALDDACIAQLCLKALAAELDAEGVTLRQRFFHLLPAHEFCKKERQNSSNIRGSFSRGVPSYFGGGIDDDLPCSWLIRLDFSFVDKSPLAMITDPSILTTMDIIHTMLKMLDIPFDIAQDCELLLFQKDIRRCFETVLLYLQQHFKGENDDFLYFPFGELEKVFQRTVSKTIQEIKSSGTVSKQQKHSESFSSCDAIKKASNDAPSYETDKQAKDLSSPLFSSEKIVPTFVPRSNSIDFTMRCTTELTHVKTPCQSYVRNEVEGRLPKRLKTIASKTLIDSRGDAICFSEEYEASKIFTADLEKMLRDESKF